MSQTKHESWIRGLDSIRFILALMVFLSHLDNPFHDEWMHSSHLLLKAFGIGWSLLFSGIGSVMAFFIISGFVIHYPYRDKIPATRPFLIRRWTRIILPLAVIGLVAGYYHKFPLIPVWSLYCELIYYTLYPLIIRIKLSWRTKLLIAFVLSFALILILTPADRNSLMHQKNLGYSGAYWQLGDWMTWMIGLPCWLLGVILAQNVDSYTRRPSTGRIWLIRVVVFGLAGLLNVLKFHLFVSYIFSMNIFAIPLFFWLKEEILYFKVKEPIRWLEYSGKFSYSLYLCHNVFVSFITMFLPLTVYSYLPIVALTIFSAFLFYLGVEKPSHLLSRQLSRLGYTKKLETS